MCACENSTGKTATWLQPDVVAHTCNPRGQRRDLRVPGQPGLQSKSFSQRTNKPPLGALCGLAGLADLQKIIFSTPKFLRILICILAVLPSRIPKMQALSPKGSNNGRASTSLYLCFLSKHNNVCRQNSRAESLSVSKTQTLITSQTAWLCWYYCFKKTRQWIFPG